ncbi:MAG: TPM domain-containing protein [Oscillospiraceae bacterium]|nr:TPM domain-containing protein [Oscillospiraceae bacterium]
MKKRLFKISALVLILSLIFSFGVFAEGTKQYVYDPVYLLTDSEYAELNTQAAEISEKYGCAVHFVITDDPSVNYDNIQVYSEDMYLESPALGYGDGKDGVMLVLGTYDRCYWLLAYGDKGNYAFTDYGKDWMSKHFVDKFGNDDWYGGFKVFIEDCDYILGEAEKGKPVDIYYEETDVGVEGYGIALVAGIIIAFIVCGIFKSQMKTANIATNAKSYFNRSAVEITNRYNRLLHTTVTRTEISDDDNDGSSSRGGTTVNSRGFSGKGGRF